MKDTKTEDDSFKLLTYAAVAKELKRRGLTESKVFLAVGLPLTRFGAEKKPFIKYLMEDKDVTFIFEQVSYHIVIDNVVVFPQCYAAVVSIGRSDFVISINITSEHIINRKLIQKLIDKVDSFKVPTKHIEFEITESMVIEDFNKAVDNIALLKSFGFKVSMDDFGTGYSSLNYLKTLPIDIIKIDKSFIDAINHDAKGRVLLENIIHLAHGFDLAVIAEGIENEDQLKVLQDMQCDMFQGYYFGKPMGKDDFERMFLIS